MSVMSDNRFPTRIRQAQVVSPVNTHHLRLTNAVQKNRVGSLDDFQKTVGKSALESIDVATTGIPVDARLDSLEDISKNRELLVGSQLASVRRQEAESTAAATNVLHGAEKAGRTVSHDLVSFV